MDIIETFWGFFRGNLGVMGHWDIMLWTYHINLRDLVQSYLDNIVILEGNADEFGTWDGHIGNLLRITL